MTKSIQNGNSTQRAVTRWDQEWGSWRDGDPSIDPLMRSGVIEIVRILLRQSPGMAFAQNEDVIQEFTPDTA
jgi:hypothetical protein